MARSNGNALAKIEDDNVVTDEAVADFINSVEEQQQAAKAPSQEDRARNAINALLGKLGSRNVQDDALKFSGSEFVLPEQYKGRVEKAVAYLEDHIEQEKKQFSISRIMPYRPFDGAHAFMEVMRTLTGTSGFGVTRMTFFGPQPPEFRSVKIGPKQGETIQVPWGLVAFPMYEATFDVAATRSNSGYTFHLSAVCPRKWRKEIEAIFNLIEDYLRGHSLYKGKAIFDDGLEPEFVDLSRVDPTQVVYSEDVTAQLEAHVWAPIRYTDAYRAQGMPRKRAILFAGKFGTGKTLGCMLTAQEAVANGWTAVMCRTGVDSPEVVMKTAELYAPAVVIIEDLDVHAGTSTKVEISRLLEMLDGATNKGNEIVALFTTNHIEEIQKGALRPGRIDAVIMVNELDEQGFRRIVQARPWAKKLLAKDVDWPVVAQAFDGFLPAFVVEAANRSQAYAMARNEGRPALITTQDLVHAANSLRPQLEMHEAAKEGVRTNLIEDGLRGLIEGTLKRTSIDGEPFSVEEATVLNGGKQ